MEGDNFSRELITHFFFFGEFGAMLGQGAVESIDLISCEPIAHFFFFGEFGAMLGQGAVESIDLISCEPIAHFFFFGEFGAMLGQSAVESIDLSVTPCKVFCEAFDLLAAFRNGAAQFRQLGTVCQLLCSELGDFSVAECQSRAQGCNRSVLFATTAGRFAGGDIARRIGVVCGR